MANQQPLRKVFHVPLHKGYVENDDGTITVVGKFTSDQKDEVGDIITRAATERAIPKYRQWRNIRYMHQPRPVGKVLRIGEEDGLAWNEVEIKVVDEQAMREVKFELLPALSIGALIKFEDIDFMEDGGWLINDYELVEISLVDHPANYDAKLDLAALPSDFRDAARNEGFVLAAKAYGIPLTEDEEVINQIEKSPPCRQADESVEECVDRKIPELIDEGMEPDQAAAAAHNMCEEACSESSLDSEEEKTMATETLPEVPEEVISEETAVEIDKDMTEELPEVEETMEEPEDAVEKAAEEEAPEALEEDAEVVEEIEKDLDEEEDTTESAVVPFVNVEELERELDIEEPEVIEEVQIEAEEETPSEFAQFKSDVLAAIQGIADIVKAQAEAPQAEEQTESEAEEATDEDVVFALYTLVEELQKKVDALEAEIVEIRKPANRKAAVRPLDLEEEAPEEVVEEKALEEEEVEDEPVVEDIRGGLREYFRTRGRLQE